MRVCVPYRTRAVGGPTTFLGNLGLGLQGTGIELTTDLSQPCDLILVLARPPLPHISLPRIIQQKRQGAKVIQRLDGIYYPAYWAEFPLRERPMMRMINLVVGYLHSRVADFVIYQSEFSRCLVNRFLPHSSSPWCVIYNGTDLAAFSPAGPAAQLAGNPILAAVHSTFQRPYELSPILDAYHIVKKVHPQALLVVVGAISPRLQGLVEEARDALFVGPQVPPAVASHMRAAHVGMFAKLNTACPNVLIESMASGLPTACYDTGANKELLGESGGICAPWQGGDYTHFEAGDPEALAAAALTLLAEHGRWSRGARSRAESMFSLELMTERYIAAFREALDG